MDDECRAKVVGYANEAMKNESKFKRVFQKETNKTVAKVDDCKMPVDNEKMSGEKDDQKKATCSRKSGNNGHRVARSGEDGMNHILEALTGRSQEMERFEAELESHEKRPGRKLTGEDATLLINEDWKEPHPETRASSNIGEEGRISDDGADSFTGGNDDDSGGVMDTGDDDEYTGSWQKSNDEEGDSNNPTAQETNLERMGSLQEISDDTAIAEEASVISSSQQEIGSKKDRTENAEANNEKTQSKADEGKEEMSHDDLASEEDCIVAETVNVAETAKVAETVNVAEAVNVAETLNGEEIARAGTTTHDDGKLAAKGNPQNENDRKASANTSADRSMSLGEYTMLRLDELKKSREGEEMVRAVREACKSRKVNENSACRHLNGCSGKRCNCIADITEGSLRLAMLTIFVDDIMKKAANVKSRRFLARPPPREGKDPLPTNVGDFKPAEYKYERSRETDVTEFNIKNIRNHFRVYDNIPTESNIGQGDPEKHFAWQGALKSRGKELKTAFKTGISEKKACDVLAMTQVHGELMSFLVSRSYFRYSEGTGKRATIQPAFYMVEKPSVENFPSNAAVAHAHLTICGSSLANVLKHMQPRNSMKHKMSPLVGMSKAQILHYCIVRPTILVAIKYVETAIDSSERREANEAHVKRVVRKGLFDEKVVQSKKDAKVEKKNKTMTKMLDKEFISTASTLYSRSEGNTYSRYVKDSISILSARNQRQGTAGKEGGKKKSMVYSCRDFLSKSNGCVVALTQEEATAMLEIGQGKGWDETKAGMGVTWKETKAGFEYRESQGPNGTIADAIISSGVCGTAQPRNSYTKHREAVLQKINELTAQVIELMEKQTRQHGEGQQWTQKVLFGRTKMKDNTKIGISWNPQNPIRWEAVEERRDDKSKGYIGFCPVNVKGMYIEVWLKGEEEGSLAFVPFGTMLVLPMETVHTGGFVSSECNNRHLFASITSERVGKLVEKVLPLTRLRHQGDIANDAKPKEDDFRVNTQMLTRPYHTYIRDGFCESGIRTKERPIIRRDDTQYPRVKKRVVSGQTHVEWIYGAHAKDDRTGNANDEAVASRVHVIAKGSELNRGSSEMKMERFVKEESAGFPNGVPRVYVPSTAKERADTEGTGRSRSGKRKRDCGKTRTSKKRQK